MLIKMSCSLPVKGVFVRVELRHLDRWQVHSDWIWRQEGNAVRGDLLRIHSRLWIEKYKVACCGCHTLPPEGSAADTRQALSRCSSENTSTKWLAQNPASDWTKTQPMAQLRQVALRLGEQRHQEVCGGRYEGFGPSWWTTTVGRDFSSMTATTGYTYIQCTYRTSRSSYIQRGDEHPWLYDAMCSNALLLYLIHKYFCPNLENCCI